MLEYETANPNQDAAEKGGEHFNPDDHSITHTHVSFAPGDSPRQNVDEEMAMHGTPIEYGAARRPYSESPAPPHPNDQFTGLAEGGMHADEMVKPVQNLGGDSDRTLASSSQGTIIVHKSAVKPGSLGSPTVGNGNKGERSMRSNTQANRNMHHGMSNDEQFYDDKQGI